jgi:hypothetical protein
MTWMSIVGERLTSPMQIGDVSHRSQYVGSKNLPLSSFLI